MRANLGQQVFEHLRTRIYRMEIEPGTRLGVGEIADELGVSRSPVRDAFLMLIAEGIIEPVSTGGYRVIQFDHKYIDDVFILRRALELAAVRLAVQRLDVERVRALQATWTEMLTADESAPDFVERYLTADNELHQGIAEMSDNALLKDALARVVSIAALVRRWQYSVGITHQQTQSTAEEHLKVLGAMLAGDADRAAAALDEHLIRAQERSLARLEQQSTVGRPQGKAGRIISGGGKKGGRLTQR